MALPAFGRTLQVLRNGRLQHVEGQILGLTGERCIESPEGYDAGKFGELLEQGVIDASACALSVR
jgi:hypothetical protein